jgi:two-component system response regulator TctD
MRVLLVEDSADVAQAIAAHLVQLGHTVDWESNGTNASALVVAEYYDLIVLDVMLPGTDDYLIKPFDFRELEARIRVLMRRMGGDATNLLRCAKLSLDRKSRTVRVDERPLELTRREVTLLEILISRPGRIFGKDELIDKLLTLEDNPNANLVEQYVARLRKKLSGAGFEIRTLRGLGYQVVLA